MTPSSGDPKPLPPVQPQPEDCCRSGCNPCVFDVYEADLHRYEREVEAWETRQQKTRARQKNLVAKGRGTA